MKITDEQIQAIEIIPSPYGDYTKNRWVIKAWNELPNEMYVGNFSGVDVFAGLAFPYDLPNRDLPQDEIHFEKYNKQELARYTRIGYEMFSPWYRGKKGLHEKQKWGFAHIDFIAFVNEIQIGKEARLASLIEVGYAPELNKFDTGDPVFLDLTTSIEHWVKTHPEELTAFVWSRRMDAEKLANDTLKKLNE